MVVSVIPAWNALAVTGDSTYHRYQVCNILFVLSWEQRNLWKCCEAHPCRNTFALELQVCRASLCTPHERGPSVMKSESWCLCVSSSVCLCACAGRKSQLRLFITFSLTEINSCDLLLFPVSRLSEDIYSMSNIISFLSLKDVFVVKFKEGFYYPAELEF